MDKLAELVIDSLTYGGRGVGRINGKAVFVPSVLPGELVKCRIVKEKKRYCEAELVSVVQPSDDRQNPPCPYFSECGGCQWQHISYAKQLQWKTKIFSDVLTRATGCDEDHLLPIVSAPNEFEYRCRAQIKCRMTAEGLVAGFYRSGTHRIVNIDNCQILDPVIPPLLKRFREAVRTFSQADCIPQLDICVVSGGQASLVVHYTGADTGELKTCLLDLSQVDNLTVSLQPHSGAVQTVFSNGAAQKFKPEDDGLLQLGFPPGGFIQVNLQQNRRLVAQVVKNLVLTGEETVLDVFSGVGNFSLPLARVCREVVAVEEYEPGVDAARNNAKNNKIENISFIAGRAERVMEQLANTSKFDAVVIDPPRAGAAKIIPALLKMQPKRIVYVSCDPTTLARDLSTLMKSGYQLMSAQAVDMFPQTWHIESVSVLEWAEGASSS